MLEDKNKGQYNNKDLVFKGQNLLDQLHNDPDRKPQLELIEKQIT
jgi:hypothetical protein